MITRILLYILFMIASSDDSDVFYCWNCDAKNKFDCNRYGILQKVNYGLIYALFGSIFCLETKNPVSKSSSFSLKIAEEIGYNFLHNWEREQLD